MSARRKPLKRSAHLLLDELLRTYTQRPMQPKKSSLLFATYMQSKGSVLRPQTKRKHTRSGSERTMPTSLHSRTNSVPNSAEALGFQKPTTRLLRTESTPNLLPAYLLPTKSVPNPYSDAKPALSKTKSAFRKTYDGRFEGLASKKPRSSRPQPPSSTLASPPSKSRPVLTIESPKFADLKHLMVSPIDMSPAMPREALNEASRREGDTTLSQLVAALDAL